MIIGMLLAAAIAVMAIVGIWWIWDQSKPDRKRYIQIKPLSWRGHDRKPRNWSD